MNQASEIQAKPFGKDEFPDIGLRLKQERRTRRMRLKDLADAARCSESLLSRIENGLVTPSLTTLYHLCKALEISVTALLIAPTEKECIVYRQGARPRYVDANRIEGERTTAEVLVPFAEGRMLEAHIWHVPVGSGWCGPYLHLGEEVGYVTEGALELKVGGDTFFVDVGDSFFFKSNLEHSFRAHGDKDCRIVWVNTPPTF
jgi:transcriptional regulator with XRE-family HTH domain